MVIKTTRKTTRILPELLIEAILNLIAYSRWAFSVLLTDGGGSQKSPTTQHLSRISYNDETWQSYTLPK